MAKNTVFGHGSMLTLLCGMKKKWIPQAECIPQPRLDKEHTYVHTQKKDWKEKSKLLVGDGFPFFCLIHIF